MSKHRPVERAVKCQPRGEGFTLSFFSMASLCEVLVETQDEKLALEMGQVAADEAWRIEDKYSRYNKSSLCSKMNAKAGEVVQIDSETYQLLEFAHQCYEMSEGAFDITSGILRKAWHFDGSDNIPSKESVEALLKFVGWHHINYSLETFSMNKGMEIDFGGFGKEYAVDRAILLLSIMANVPFLVNYGGDLATFGKKKNNEPWQIGVEHPAFKAQQSTIVTVKEGAIATSGDANRFLLKDGQRYSHILNVTTGWPV
ncbi:MAG: FAD:protein FMN transferase, partial [Colwellia sp.]|nr:FAD:protein FMN transferase [Colwellia sp.]